MHVAGEVLEVTPEHPFLVNGEWLTADKLTTYHKLTLYDGTTTAIEKIETEKLATPKKVYNFAVQGYNSYFVGDSKVLVHNCKMPHANSKLSAKKQIVYGLKNEDTGLIEKVGISSGKVDKNGKPYRANKQKNEQNGKGGNYSVVILDEVEAGKGAREKALNLEVEHTNANAESINDRLHKKPKPNPKK